MAGDEQKKSDLKTIGALCLVPIGMIALALVFRAASGPFWIARNIDPEYAYLFSSLNIARLHTPIHVDHPGMPPQELAAVALRLVGLVRGYLTGFASDVFRHTELYLTWINNVYLLVMAGSVFWLGRFVFRKTQSLSTALIFQALPLLSPSYVAFLHRVTAEQMLIVASFLSSWLCLCWSLESKGELEKRSKRVVASALVSGLGLATKVTFFPLTLVPLFFLKSLREFWRYAWISVVTFFAVTLPMAKRMPQFFHWMGAILTHKGKHGSGGSGLLDTAQLGNRFSMLVQSDIALPIFWAILLIAIGVMVFQKRRDSVFRGLLAILTASALQLLMVLKHFEVYYLIPQLVLLAGGMSLIFYDWKRRMRLPAAAARMLPELVVAILVLGVGVHTWKVCDAQLAQRRQMRDESLDAERVVAERGCKIQISHYTGLAYALNFGRYYGHELDGQEIGREFPGRYFYEPATHQLNDWKGPLHFSVLPRANGDCVTFAAPNLSSWGTSPPTEFRLKPITPEGRSIMVYEVLGPT